MNFNADKCSAISIGRKKRKLSYPYTLHQQVLKRVDSATYLGVELSKDLTWAHHMNKTTMKANRQLGFLRRNIPIRNQNLKEIAYKGIVRPILEYCAPVWDPHHTKYIDQLEMVQRRAARFVLGRPHRPMTEGISSVTNMLQQLKWESLEHRRKASCVTMFYRVQYSLVAVSMPAIVVRADRSRPGHPHQYLVPFCSTKAYMESFFPKAIRLWNSLPADIACQSSLSLFQTALSSHSF